MLKSLTIDSEKLFKSKKLILHIFMEGVYYVMKGGAIHLSIE